MPVEAPISVMISSRVQSAVRLGRRSFSLESLRQDLKHDLESETFLGERIFVVWTNEDAPSAGANSTWWEACLKRAKESDIVLALYTGDAGTPAVQRALGICHAELETAYAYGATRVRIVDLTNGEALPTGETNLAFQRYLQQLRPITNTALRSKTAFLQHCRQTVRDAVVDLARQGLRTGDVGGSHLGEALKWGLLSFEDRKRTLEQELAKALAGKDDGLLTCVSNGGRILGVRMNAVPAAMSNAAAREMVGQPFRDDHVAMGNRSPEVLGPVHVVACHRGVTEAQALRMLGIPDGIAITTPFGIHVVDPVEFVQMTFIAHCRDSSAIRNGVARMYEWWTQSGEGARVAERAAKRRRIVEAISQGCGSLVASSKMVKVPADAASRHTPKGRRTFR